MRKIKTWAAAAAMLALSGAAQSALINRGGGMIYDTTANITWLADMNYAVTSGYAASGVAPGSMGEIYTDGRMGWAAAKSWADNLVYGGFSDWRLPTLNRFDTTCSHSGDEGDGFGLQYFGYNCTGGELSRLFVAELGNKVGSVLDQTGDTAEQIANLALFSNVQSSNYWSGTEYAPNTGIAWTFYTDGGGLQSLDDKRFGLYAVAVRPGDVAASVPEPQTLALALMALGAAMVGRSKRQR